MVNIMKKSTMFLIAALIGTVIMGACSGNDKDNVIDSSGVTVTAVETIESEQNRQD